MDTRTRNIISKTIHIEGGYVNDPDDPGGETNHGISKRSFPKVDIENVTFEQAIELGYQFYWIPNNLDTIITDGYAWKCFDIAFNCGNQALDLLETDIYPEDKDDETCVDDLIKGLEIHYDEIVDLQPRSKKFLAGWDNRAVMKYHTGERYDS